MKHDNRDTGGVIPPRKEMQVKQLQKDVAAIAQLSHLILLRILSMSDLKNHATELKSLEEIAKRNGAKND